MKKKLCVILLFLSSVAVFFLAINRKINSYNELSLYSDVLKECEWVWENWEGYKQKRDEGRINDIYDGIFSYAIYAGKYGYTLVYCIQDINDDDMPELIVGVKDIQNNIENYMIKIIFYYEDETLNYYFVDRYMLEIYKGGIIELCMGAGIYTEYRYSHIVPGEGKREILGDLEFVDEKPPRFYQIIDLMYENKVEITEEQFYNQKNMFTGKGKEQLNWTDLDGFWDKE